MNEELQLKKAIHLLSVWCSKIALQNAIDFNDINKISEELAANLLNAVYGYSLKNLNEETRNFPAVDLGDDVAKIAFQITSTMNAGKIQSTLEGFVQHKLEEKFTNGVRFFFLTTSKKIRSKKNSREKYQSIYSDFDSEKHLLTLHDLIQEIRNLQTKDKEKFHKVLTLLIDSLDVQAPEKIVELLLNKHQKELQAKDEQLQAKDEERKNLIQAVTALSQGQNILGTEAQIEQAMSALAEGDTTEAENLFEQVTQKGEQEAKHTAQAYRNLGALAYLHDTQKALNAYRRATELAPDNAIGWNQLGHLLVRIGELNEAIEVYEKVLGLGETHYNQEEIAAAYGNLGNIYSMRGQLDNAIEFCEKSLSIYEVLGSEKGIAINYGNLGLVYEINGKLDKAIESYEKSLAIYKGLDDKGGMANQYGNLGNICQIHGKLDEAIEFYEKSLAIFEILGSKEGISTNYGNLGIIHQTQGKLEKAIEFHEKSLAIEKNLNRKKGIASSYGNLGLIYQMCGELDKAIKFLEKSLEIYEILGLKEHVARSLGNLGTVFQIYGELDKAIEFYEKSLSINESLGIKAGIASNYGNLGIIYHIQGDEVKAQQHYQISIALFEALNSPNARKIRNYSNILQQQVGILAVSNQKSVSYLSISPL